jgi:hypothetical protein
MSTSGIRWGRILLYGFLTEVAIGVLFALAFTTISTEVAQYVATLVSFAGALVFGYIAARGVESQRILHGSLVGLTAVLIYYAIVLIGAQVAAMMKVSPDQTNAPTVLYTIANLLKLGGGALGGYLAERRQLRPVSSRAAAAS